MSLEPVVTAAALLAVVWTALPLLRHDAWWIRVFDFPRVQVLVVTLAALAAYLAIAGWRDALDMAVIGLLSAATMLQAIRIIPYTPAYRRAVTDAAGALPDETISALVANVLTPNRNADALLRLVRERDPDLVLAVETDRWWESRLDALEADYPYTVKHPLDNLYGMHLYARLPLVDPEVRFLVEDGVPSIHADIVLRSGHRVALHCLHPAPPSPTENPTSAERDAELLVVARARRDDPRSAIVMGDLNDVAWSSTTRLFRRLSGLLDPRIGRGMFSTFHARYPGVRWPLDHVFCSSDFTVVSLARLPYWGSDHFPIHVVLAHTPAAAAVHDEPEAEPGDHDRAAAKIDEVGGDDDALRRDS